MKRKKSPTVAEALLVLAQAVQEQTKLQTEIAAEAKKERIDAKFAAFMKDLEAEQLLQAEEKANELKTAYETTAMGKPISRHQMHLIDADLASRNHGFIPTYWEIPNGNYSEHQPVIINRGGLQGIGRAVKSQIFADTD
jgi:hypothetical protein